MTDNQMVELLKLFHEIEKLMVLNGAKITKNDGTPTSFSDKVKSFDKFEAEPDNPGDIGYKFYFKNGSYYIKDQYDYGYEVNRELSDYQEYKSYKKRYWEYRKNLLGGNFSRLKKIGHERNQLLHIYNYNVRFYLKFKYDCNVMIKFLKNYKKKTFFGYGKSNFEKDSRLKDNNVSFIDRGQRFFSSLFINTISMIIMIFFIKILGLLFEFDIKKNIAFIISLVLFYGCFLSAYGDNSIRGFMSKSIKKFTLILATALLVISATSIFDSFLKKSAEDESKTYQEVVKIIEKGDRTISFLKSEFKNDQEYYRVEVNKILEDKSNQISAMNYLYYLNERNIAGIQNGFKSKISRELRKVYKYNNLMKIEYQSIVDSNVDREGVSLTHLYKNRSQKNSNASILSYYLLPDDFSKIDESTYMGSETNYAASKVLIFKKDREKLSSLSYLKPSKIKKNVTCSYYYIQANDTNVRFASSASSRIIDSLNINEKVCITEIKRHWYYILDKGWVKNKYLSDTRVDIPIKTKNPTKKDVPCSYFYVKTNNLNVRLKANSKSRIVKKLKLNEKLCIKKKETPWYYISNIGWVHSDYLSDKKVDESLIKKKLVKNDVSVWHCSAKSERASGWVERIGKKNAMNGALNQCEIRRVSKQKCSVDNCYQIR